MNRRGWLVLGVLGLLTIGFGVWYVRQVQTGLKPEPMQTQQTPSAEPVEPKLASAVLLEGLSHVWEVAFLPDQTLLFTERAGTISKLADGQKIVVATVPAVFARGEGGLLGLAVDPDFTANRYIYACYNTGQDVRISRWKLSQDAASLSDQQNIITGMPVNPSGRHSGCRLSFGPDQHLWVGTGDAALDSLPQEPSSLGGKILRVNRNGKAVPGNLSAPFDPRIFSSGHRNTQGLALLTSERGGSFGFSVEHGPDKNDEVNPLKSGNFGWDPGPGYKEAVPMTDKQKFPDAIDSIWQSGESTIAPSGMTLLTGSQWGAYENRLAVAVLKDKQVRLLEIDDSEGLKSEKVLFEGAFGRIRSVVLGPQNALYLTTDNGGGKDQIIKITPSL